jgi:hypothetical protein
VISELELVLQIGGMLVLQIGGMIFAIMPQIGGIRSLSILYSLPLVLKIVWDPRLGGVV